MRSSIVTVSTVLVFFYSGFVHCLAKLLQLLVPVTFFVPVSYQIPFTHFSFVWKMYVEHVLIRVYEKKKSKSLSEVLTSKQSDEFVFNPGGVHQQGWVLDEEQKNYDHAQPLHHQDWPKPLFLLCEHNFNFVSTRRCTLVDIGTPTYENLTIFINNMMIRWWVVLYLIEEKALDNLYKSSSHYDIRYQILSLDFIEICFYSRNTRTVLRGVQ